MNCNHCKRPVYYGKRSERSLRTKLKNSDHNIEMWRHVHSENPECDRGDPIPLPEHLENSPDAGPALVKKRWEGG